VVRQGFEVFREHIFFLRFLLQNQSSQSNGLINSLPKFQGSRDSQDFPSIFHIPYRLNRNITYGNASVSQSFRPAFPLVSIFPLLFKAKHFAQK